MSATEGLRSMAASMGLEVPQAATLMMEAADTIDRLDAENAKLRELVSDFDKCLTEAARLAYIQGHMTIYDGTLLDSLHPRMRELGMETSE